MIQHKSSLSMYCRVQIMISPQILHLWYSIIPLSHWTDNSILKTCSPISQPASVANRNANSATICMSEESHVNQGEQMPEELALIFERTPHADNVNPIYSELSSSIQHSSVDCKPSSWVQSQNQKSINMSSRINTIRNHNIYVSSVLVLVLPDYVLLSRWKKNSSLRIMNWSAMRRMPELLVPGMRIDIQVSRRLSNDSLTKVSQDVLVIFLHMHILTALNQIQIGQRFMRKCYNCEIQLLDCLWFNGIFEMSLTTSDMVQRSDSTLKDLPRSMIFCLLSSSTLELPRQFGMNKKEFVKEYLGMWTLLTRIDNIEVLKDGVRIKDWCHVLVNGTGFLNDWKCMSSQDIRRIF